MTGWWNSIPGFEKVFWYFAIPFSVIFVMQLLATFAGLGDGANDVDAIDDVDADGADSAFGDTFKLFTIRNFITFFTVFGWSGITFTNMGISKGLTILFSTILGLIVMGIVSALFYSIIKLTSSGNMDLKYAKGLTGQVYIGIPGKRGGVGKIQITFQDAYREVAAMTDEGEKIGTGTMVRVVDVLDNQMLLVERI